LSSRDNHYQGAPLPAQSVITRTITVAPGPFAPGHLGELTQLVPFDMIDEILTDTRTVQTRIRDLPSRVVVYLLLAGCLFTDLGYNQVWHRLVAGLHGLNTATPTAGALSQARRRIGIAPLKALLRSAPPEIFRVALRQRLTTIPQRPSRRVPKSPAQTPAEHGRGGEGEP